MKKLFAAILVLVLLLSSAAAADEIRFLDLPWLSSVESTLETVRGALTETIPSGYPDKVWIDGNWIVGEGWMKEELPVFILDYSCDPCCEVAGLQVNRITLWFVPEGDGGKYTDESPEGYQLVRTEYRFAEDEKNDFDGVFSLLELKMRYLYGEPAETRSGGGSGDNYSEDSETFVWAGDNMSQAALNYTSTSYRDGTTSGKLTVTYGYGDLAFYEGKAALEYDYQGDEPEEETPDVGLLNGL